MTAAGETSRLRWNNRHADTFQTAHPYLPQPFIAAAAEHYRRQGAPCPGHPLTALVCRDDLMANVVAMLLRAMEAGAPDMSAEAVGQWLAVHLLSPHAPWCNAVGDNRDPGRLTDARLRASPSSSASASATP